MDVLNLSQSITEGLSLAALGSNLFLSGILSFILSLYYVRYGKTLTNRASLGKDFTMISLTTTLIITVVKSSLALSLGLVGALSIVRFRAAIKEPEELTYLFLAIAIGLGFGADQAVPTVFAFVVILLLVHLRNLFLTNPESQNLYLNFEMGKKPSENTLDKITSLLAKNAKRADLKRFVQNNGVFQATFLVDFEDISQINQILSDLEKIEEGASVTFIDQSRYFKG